MENRILDPDTRRFGRILHAAGAILAAAGVAIAYTAVYTPMLEATRATREEISDLATKLRDAPRIRTEHTTLQKRLREASRRMKTLRARIPNEDRVAQFVSHVTDIAAEVDVEISDFDARPSEHKNGYSQREITFTGAGGYAALCRFVNRVHDLPRLSRVTGLDIMVDPSDPSRYPATFRVITYFGLEEEPATNEASGTVEGANNA